MELLPLSCWSAVVDLLSARDLLSLSLSTKAVQQLLNSTPGIWCQAVCNCLLACAAAGTSSSNRTASRAVAGVSGASGNSSNHWHTRQQQQAAAAAAPTGSSTSDEAAHHMLSATTALAYSCQRLKPQMKPQCYLLPPWLAAQPGKARGLVRAEQVQTLNPALMLSQAQVHWLSLGCLSGVFGERGGALALRQRLQCKQPVDSRMDAACSHHMYITAAGHVRHMQHLIKGARVAVVVAMSPQACLPKRHSNRHSCIAILNLHTCTCIVKCASFVHAACRA